MEKIKNWVLDHDERWSFIALYVGAAVLLSIFANLFWVAMLAVVHIGIELWRHVAAGNRHPVLQAIWCTKLDIALILFSLVIVVYADVVMAALGLGQAARGAAMAGGKIVTRFAIIERALRVVFMTVDDFARVAQLVFKSRKGKNAAGGPLPDEALDHEAEMQAHGLSGGDIFSLGFGALCAGLIIMSPALIDIDFSDVLRLIGNELHP